jgi:DNA-binding MarR family transcriptional regulator
MARAKGAEAVSPAEEIGRDCLAARLRLFNRVITRLYDDALRAHGITVAQLNMLSAVAQFEPIAAGKLSDLLSLKISTLSRSMHLMEKSGLLEISAAERGNGRVIRLTAAGARKLEDVLPAWREAQLKTSELMGSKAQTALAGVADSLLAEQLARS